MLFHLSIENVALIENAEVNFEEGFHVLTGETGAGKSILIGSINMLLGERVGRDIIRSGENYAYVEGVFYPNQQAIELLAKQDVFPDDGCLIVSRKLFSDGKNICKVGGKTVSVSLLREIGRLLVNVHGQHDNQALLDHTSHISFLDAAVPETEQKTLTEYEKVYLLLKEQERRLAEFDMDETEKMRRMDMLNYEIDEITKAELYPGEEDELKAKRSILKNRAMIEENCTRVLDVLYENTDGICVYNLLSDAQNALEIASHVDQELEEVSGDVLELVYSLEEIVNKVRHKIDRMEMNDFSVNELEERLDLIYKLKRKYGATEEEIIAYCKNAQQELEQIESADNAHTELMESIERLTKDAERLAKINHKIRLKTAENVQKKICEELSALNMECAQFEVAFEETELCRNGTDKIEFLLSANRGEPLKPLSKIVSGGELSRIMLALKNVLTDGDVAETLIFDEIDSGISGRVAGKVGLKLKEISRKKQVLCVTHLPQIASLSDHHYKISKQAEMDKTNTSITSLDGDGKVTEIAFMIGGDNVTSTTLSQAKEMILDGAGQASE